MPNTASTKRIFFGILRLNDLFVVLPSILGIFKVSPFRCALHQTACVRGSRFAFQVRSVVQRLIDFVGLENTKPYKAYVSEKICPTFQNGCYAANPRSDRPNNMTKSVF